MEALKIREGVASECKEPIILFSEGDGIGKDICNAARNVIDEAVRKAYSDRKIFWKEVLLGEKAEEEEGSRLPDKTIEELKKIRVLFKGPLETPVGSGFRSINVSIRILLDLYANIRPVKYMEGLPSPLKDPRVDLIVFRENTDDIYTGIEWQAGSDEAKHLISILEKEFNAEVEKDSGIGIKPMSKRKTERVARLSIKYCL
ncbi:MAG: isocitrate/isopropylmalate family dehydrogenase, partial [Candidatus Micrarchaeaceae archaeon]